MTDKKRYEALEHTADIMIRAFGSSMEEILENAAFGMFDQMADLSNVMPNKTIGFEIEGDKPSQLLVDLLSELLFIHETQMVLLSEFRIKYDGEMLRVEASGEEIDKRRHQMKNAIKAVSYHALEFSTEKGYAQVLFDA